MPLRQTPPGRGGVPARVFWVYIPTGKGEQWHAHVAGPCHWFECHTKGRSKPCLRCITGDELKCESCGPFNPVEPVGYQPLYRESDGRPCMTIVHDYAREQVDALKLHQRVVVGRNRGSTDGVYVMAALKTEPRYQTQLPERKRPADLTDTLLRVWAMPELTAWYVKQHRDSDIALSPPPPPTTKAKSGMRLRSNGQPFSPFMQAAAAAVGIEPVDPMTNEAFVTAVKNAQTRKEIAERKAKGE